MKPITERLWDRVDVRGPDDCWEWQGWRHPGGHGQIGWGKRGTSQVYTHVLAWMIDSGSPVPERHYVCHICNNPPCCNPKHLYAGTPAQNTADMLAIGGHSHGEKHATKLTDEKVFRIREMRASGLKHQEIADLIGVSRSMIGHILNGERWRHL